MGFAANREEASQTAARLVLTDIENHQAHMNDEARKRLRQRIDELRVAWNTQRFKNRIKTLSELDTVDATENKTPSPTTISESIVLFRALREALAEAKTAPTVQASFTRPDARKEDEVDNGSCIVCKSYQASTICIPCNHVCLCNACARHDKTMACPLCQAVPTSIQTVFLP